jgi:hypothetical protein
MRTTIDFSDAAAVRELAAAGERMVCLQFPESLGSLYCHSCLLALSSPVLRNVLEDTQHDAQLCTIPLAGDTNVSVWKLALGLIYHLKAATITLDNAQTLLLLAHKYDMDCVTGGCRPRISLVHNARMHHIKMCACACLLANWRYPATYMSCGWHNNVTCVAAI